MKRSIKVEKKKQELPIEIVLGQSLNTWSRSIRSWVAEYRLRDKTTPMPSFDSLFNDEAGHEAHQAGQPTNLADEDREGARE